MPSVITLLRLEGGGVFTLSVTTYVLHGGSGWLWLLVLLPDLSFLAYSLGPKIGAAVYNAAHTYLVPLMLALIGLLTGLPVCLRRRPDLERPHRRRPLVGVRPQAAHWIWRHPPRPARQAVPTSSITMTPAPCPSQTTPATQFFQHSGSVLAYDDQGNGPLIVAVPRLGDLRQTYRWLTPTLVAAGYRVVKLDPRGQGESSAKWPSYSQGRTRVGTEFPA